jgi:uncharacterized protein
LHVLVLVLSAPGLLRLTASADTRVFFGENRYHQDLRDFEASFRQNNNVLILLRYNGERIDRSAAFARILREATNESWKLTRVLRVESLATYPHVVVDADDSDSFEVKPLLDVVCPTDCDATQSALLDDPILRARLISNDGTTVGVYLTFDLPYESVDAVQAITRAVRDLTDRLRDSHAGVEAMFVGDITMMDAFNEAAQRDAATLFPLVLATMVIVLVVMVGELRLVGYLIATGVYGVIVAMGIAGWIGMVLNIATTVTPVIILTLCVASGLHMMLTFQRQVVAQPHDVPRAAKITDGLNRGPVFLANLTTVVGFVSMNTADSPPIRELGNLAAVGLTAGTSLLLLVVPDRLARIRELRVLPTVEWIRPMLERLTHGNARQRAVLAFAIAIACIAGIPRVDINDDFVRYFDESFEFRRAADFSQQHMSGPNYIDLAVVSGKPDGIYDPRYLSTVRELSTWLRAQPLVANVASLSDIVAEIAEKFGTPDFTTLTQNEIAQFVLTYELSLTAGQDLDDFFDKSRDSTRVSVLLSGGNSQSVTALEDSIYRWFREHAPPEFRVVVTGINIPVSHMSLLNIRSMLVGMLASLVVIAVAVAIYFRDLRVVLFIGPTILLPMAMGFGLWGWFVGDIGFAAAVIAAMTIGILDYDAIHITYRYRHARRVLGVAPEEAVDVTLMTVGHAVLVNSIALAAGFFLLVFSGFEVNRALGLCTTLIMLSGLVVHLLLIPSSLAWLDRRGESRLSLPPLQEGK